MGCTLLHTTFFLAFAITNSRAEEAFTWIFERLREVYTELKLDLPRTLATDNEKGIITPIREVFPEAAHLFCIWHVQEDVIAWARKKLVEQEDLNRNTPPEEISAVVERRLNEFEGHWNAVIYSSTETAFDETWGALNAKYVESFPAVIATSRIRGWGTIRRSYVSHGLAGSCISITWLRIEVRGRMIS